VILAHFTGNDTSSFLLVTGIALIILGARMLQRRRVSEPVSYTHLTLPTICSV